MREPPRFYLIGAAVAGRASTLDSIYYTCLFLGSIAESKF